MLRDMTALKEYLNHERGRLTKLAASLGITPGAICQWDRVPAERVLDVERETGISRHDLRPDIFGAAPQAGTAIEAA